MTINIPEPSWNSPLTGAILELEQLRRQRLYSKVPPYIFFQLKEIFQLLETLGSARIEGNNTTLSEYVEKIIEKNSTVDETRQELENIEEAIGFIEDNTNEDTKIDRAYISHLHNIVVQKLTPPPRGEGSKYPGELRKDNVEINGANHVPPTVSVLKDRFDEFIEFIANPVGEQNQLLMVAIAHHRFMHIHPFDNGNGRMGRLLNYALLIKLGFNVKAGRIINPSSVFYTDRDKYYEMLGLADSLNDSDLLQWSEYFLNGLTNQIHKIDGLMNIDYVQEHILLPTLKIALDRENKMVMPIEDGGRIYTIRFANNYLLRGIVKTLKDNGFVAEFLNSN